MKTVLSVLGVIATLTAAGWTAGLLLPATTSASRTQDFAAPPERVFALVTDVGRQAEWRRDVASVEVVDDGARWIERTKSGLALAFTRVAAEAPRLFTTRFGPSRASTAAGRARSNRRGTAAHGLPSRKRSASPIRCFVSSVR